MPTGNADHVICVCNYMYICEHCSIIPVIISFFSHHTYIQWQMDKKFYAAYISCYYPFVNLRNIPTIDENVWYVQNIARHMHTAHDTIMFHPHPLLLLHGHWGHYPMTAPVPVKQHIYIYIHNTWWRHQMETFSALLAICAENSPVPCEFPAQRPVMRSFDVFFDLRLNKRLSKQWWGW